MSAQTEDILCVLPPDVSASLSVGFLFRGNVIIFFPSSLNRVSLQWRCVSVAVGMQSFNTLARIANEELSNFLKGFQGGMVADWDVCLHSERGLFPVMV